MLFSIVGKRSDSWTTSSGPKSERLGFKTSILVRRLSAEGVWSNQMNQPCFLRHVTATHKQKADNAD